MKDEHAEFWKSQFQFLALCVLVVIGYAFVVHIIHDKADQSNTQQAWQVLILLLGYLGGLVQGSRERKQFPQGDKGNGAAPDASQKN